MDNAQCIHANVNAGTCFGSDLRCAVIRHKPSTKQNCFDGHVPCDVSLSLPSVSLSLSLSLSLAFTVALSPQNFKTSHTPSEEGRKRDAESKTVHDSPVCTHHALGAPRAATRGASPVQTRQDKVAAAPELPSYPAHLRLGLGKLKQPGLDLAIACPNARVQMCSDVVGLPGRSCEGALPSGG